MLRFIILCFAAIALRDPTATLASVGEAINTAMSQTAMSKRALRPACHVMDWHPPTTRPAASQIAFDVNKAIELNVPAATVELRIHAFRIDGPSQVDLQSSARLLHWQLPIDPRKPAIGPDTSRQIGFALRIIDNNDPSHVVDDVIQIPANTHNITYSRRRESNALLSAAVIVPKRRYDFLLSLAGNPGQPFDPCRLALQSPLWQEEWQPIVKGLENTGVSLEAATKIIETSRSQLLMEKDEQILNDVFAANQTAMRDAADVPKATSLAVLLTIDPWGECDDRTIYRISLPNRTVYVGGVAFGKKTLAFRAEAFDRSGTLQWIGDFNPPTDDADLQRALTQFISMIP